MIFGFILEPDRIKRGQDGTKKDVKSFKVPKNNYTKSAQEGSQEAPEEFQDLKKGFQKWTRMLLIFGPILGIIWRSNIVQKVTQTWDQKRA